ncbi:MAG: GNAT family N-acetyltransferase [Chloroflexota bacterium]|nr:GNAT family N-acetyltransferase [Chloroflexota bacterium]
MNGDPRGWYQHALASEAAQSKINVLRVPVAHLSAGERADMDILTCRSGSESDHAPLALAESSSAKWSVMVKAGERVVAHTGIVYRVIFVGDLRVAVGGITSVMTLPEFRGRGYAGAVLSSAAAFAGVWLWAPFLMVLCEREYAAFYEALGWNVLQVPISFEHTAGHAELEDRVAVVLACQGDRQWPTGAIDLRGPVW